MFYFEEISNIPRESGNEKAISDYLVNFAKNQNLEVFQDKALNVVIKKKASIRNEHKDAIILQGHMDMVCVKEEKSDFDFDVNPLELVVDGDFIRAKDTTLGADNGIAVAMTLALLEEDEAIHPPLEALFTTEEETGMSGVLGLDGSVLKGKTLINMDSEEEGEFCVSCAGGVRVIFKMPFTMIENVCERSYKISISDLTGGHSGIEIDKGRANAIKLLGRILNVLRKDIFIAHVDGGEKMNAIAKRVTIKISTNTDIKEKMEKIANTLKLEYKNTDPDMKIEFKQIENNDMVLDGYSTKKLMHIINLMPNGVNTMSSDIEGLVESSSNIGVIYTKEDKVCIDSSVRSSTRSVKNGIVNKFYALAGLTDSRIKLTADYPEWQYKQDSEIRDLMMETYEQMFNIKAKIISIHAGLECGILKEKLGDIDIISFGPNMWDVHTPDEHVSISSVERSYNLLRKVLERV